MHLTNKDSDSQIGPGDATKFEEVVLIGIGFGSVMSLLFHVFVKEQVFNNSNGKINVAFICSSIFYITIETSFTLISVLGSLRTSTRTISVLLKDVQLYQVACIYMPTRLFVNLSQIYVPLYLHDSLSMPATSLAIIPLLMFLSSFVMSLIIEKLNTKLGRKISYCFGAMLGLCACIWIHFGTGATYTKYQIYPVSLILGNTLQFFLNIRLKSISCY